MRGKIKALIAMIIVLFMNMLWLGFWLGDYTHNFGTHTDNEYENVKKVCVGNDYGGGEDIDIENIDSEDMDEDGNEIANKDWNEVGNEDGLSIKRVNGDRGVTVTVDASRSLGKRNLTEPQLISPYIYGQNLALWRNYTYDPNSISWRGYSRMVPVTKAINVTMFRFPGGATANNIYFDHNNSLNWFEHVPQEWTYPLTNSWSNVLRADTIDYFIKFCRDIGAEPLMQVNQPIRNISQAAELVYYCNVEHNYNVRYWQIGNEPDIDSSRPLDKRISDYMANWRDYVPAMKAVDPTIEIMGPTPVSPNNVWVGYLLANDTKNVSYVSFHYYPTYVGAPNPEHEPTIENLLQWSADNGACGISSINWWADRMYNELKKYNCSAGLAITEFSSVAGGWGNLGFGGKFGVSDVHAYAIYLADMLPRFGEWGIDIATQWELEAQDTAAYTLINGIDRYPDSQGRYYDLRPAYYTYLLFAKYWGDVSIYAQSSDEPNVGAHATLSTKDENKLYVLVVNKEWWGGGKDINIVLNNFVPSGAPANVYELTADAIDSNDTTKLNGVRLDRANPESTLANLPIKRVNVTGNNIYYNLPKLGIAIIEVEGSYTKPANNPPPTPSPKSPENGVTLPYTRPYLNCTEVKDPDGDKVEYEFVVDNNADFSSPEITKVIKSPSFPMNWKMRDGEYYWRVRAKDNKAFNSYSEWSNVYKFTISRALEYNTKVVVFENREQPKNNSVVNPEYVNMRWNYRDWDGDKVKFDIYLDPIGAKTLYMSGYEEPEFMNISIALRNLYPGTKYYWRVVADDGYSKTEGPVWTFTTSGEAGDRPPFVAQIMPENDKQVSPGNVHFEWLGEDLEGSGVSYKLYVDTTNANSVVYEGSGTSYEMSLTEGVYYWRVSASDGAKESMSNKYKLIVRTNNAPSIELISPKNGGVVASELASFNFKGMDPDGQKLRYDIYLDQKDGSTLVATGLGYPSYSAVLEDGIYKWKVAVSDGITTTISDVWSFEMKRNAEVPPEIEILNPRDGDTVYGSEHSSGLKLEWFGTDANNDALTYKVYLDSSDCTTVIAEGLTTISYVYTGISEGNYKWKVVVSDGKHEVESAITSFYYKINTPPSITLFFPPDGGVVTSNYTMLSWLGNDPDSQELSYKIYLDNENATEILHEGKENVYNTTLSRYKPYAWKVVVSDGIDEVESVVSRFMQKPTGEQSPPMVLPYYPAEGAIVKTHDIELRWLGGDLNGDDITYELYADANDGSTLITTTNEMCFILSGLNDKATYKWKVVAKDRNGSTESGIMSFTVDLSSVIKISAPEIISPVDGAIFDNSIVVLKCKSEEKREDIRFRFLVSRDNEFSSVVSNRTVGVIAEETERTSETTLILMPGKYYWKVQVLASEGRSAWSDVRSFTVQTSRTGVSCMLRAPAEGEVIRTSSVRFYWDCAGKDTLTKFALYLDREKGNVENMNPDSCVCFGISEMQYEVDGLLDGSTYYWTVIAIRANTISETHNVNQFKTDIIQTVLVYPQNGSEIGKNWVILRWESSEDDKDSKVEYDVYFDDKDGRTLYKTTSELSVQIMGLAEGKRYFWTVVPKIEGSRGVCVSGVWSFGVQRSEHLVLKISKDFISQGEEITIKVECASGLEVSEYYFVFGDGKNSGWVSECEVKHRYERAGVYYVAVKGRYSNGTEVEWSDAVVVQVSEPTIPSQWGTIVFGTLLMVCLAIIVYFMYVRRKKMVTAIRKRLHAKR